MLIPVRCFSCGKPVSEVSEEYEERVKKGEEPAKVMDDLGISNYCCRRMLLSQVPLIDEVLHYKRY